jgi:indole-3-glycerol phosphate synthase
LTPQPAKTGTVLDRIVVVRRKAVEAAKRAVSEAQLEERIAAAPPVRDFRAALRREGINIIAECKKESPSRGLIRADYNPAALAPALEDAGACALSVLTEPDFFGGSLDDLAVARSLVDLPVLRKDFIFDSYQLLEARAAGADAFLLIVAMLAGADLRNLMDKGKELGMAALVETHTEEEVDRALDAGADIIGINNRNLKTFEVDVEVSGWLLEKIPEGCLAVSESGFQHKEDLERLRQAGFHAFLVGTHLMEAPDPAAALRALLGPQAGTP